jgi:hypothetical protein
MMVVVLLDVVVIVPAFVAVVSGVFVLLMSSEHCHIRSYHASNL